MSFFNQFTNLDFNDLRTQIKDFLRGNSNFTDFDFEGSNFSTLIDILAYNSYITAFNTNMAVNESYLDSATLRENVVSLAKNIGYVPRSKKAAKAIVSFSVDTSEFKSRTVTLKAGIVALGIVESGSYIFSIPEDVTVPVDNSGFANFENLEIYEGSFQLKNYTYDSNQFNQRFIIPNPNVDTSTIRVEVISTVKEKYNFYSNIFEISPESKIFLLQEIEDEKYEILFGDNILGKKPESGSGIQISYIVTNGKDANGARNFNFSGILLDNNNNAITNSVSLVNVINSAENGDDIESIDSIKYIAPRVYASQYRAVTTNDYQGLIPYLFSNIDSVTAYGGEELDPPEYGKVFLSIKPRNGSFLSRITKEEIKRKLKQYSIAGTVVEIVDLSYLYVELDISVYYNESLLKDKDELKTKILGTIENYSKSKDLNSFGGRFKYSKFLSLIDNSSSAITSNITKVLIRRDLNVAYNTLANYELCYGNKFHIKRGNYNIKSSGFRVLNVPETLYLSDSPNPDNKTGKIFFFKLVENSPVVVFQNAGTIDYVRGEIKLNPIIITSTDVPNYIQIQAIPDSNDVIAYKDIYLQLNTENIKLNIIEDTLSSGENSSGTQYFTTSSYLNGDYIR